MEFELRRVLSISCTVVPDASFFCFDFCRCFYIAKLLTYEFEARAISFIVGFYWFLFWPCTIQYCIAFERTYSIYLTNMYIRYTVYVFNFCHCVTVAQAGHSGWMNNDFFFFESEFVFRSACNVAQRRSRKVSTRYD